jgi:hypothetical protein
VVAAECGWTDVVRRPNNTEEDDQIPPSSSLWRQEVAARAEELESLLSVFGNDLDGNKRQLRTAVEKHIREARRAATARGLAVAITGAPIQRAVHNLDMAEVNLYRIVPIAYLQSVLPVLTDDTADVLPAHDSRLQRLILLRGFHGNGRLKESDREAVVAAVYAAKKASLAAQARVRGFRNVILVAIGLALLVAGSLVLLGLLAPEILSLCQYPPASIPSGTPPPVQAQPQLLCPSGIRLKPGRFDTLLVMFVGVLGATVAAIFALRKVRGTNDPYSLAVTLAILKLPTGSLTAFLGPFLIQGGFIPGFAYFDNAAQFISWAVLFGYSQELFTSLVDRQAAAVLSSVPAVGVPGPSAVPLPEAPPPTETETKQEQLSSVSEAKPKARRWYRR